MKYYNTFKAEFLWQILFQIRCDFANKKKLKVQKKLAIIICKELIEETEGDENLKTLLKYIKKYKPNYDGRYFRYEFPEGYEGLKEYFNKMNGKTN